MSSERELPSLRARSQSQGLGGEGAPLSVQPKPMPPSAYQPPLRQREQRLSQLSDIRRYRIAFGRQLIPKHLPHSVTQRGKAWGRFIFFFFGIFVLLEVCGHSVDYFALPPEISLAPPIWVHLLVVCVLALVITRLIPPSWERTVLIDHRGVRVQGHGLLRREEWFVPLSQYRGVVPLVHSVSRDDGERFEEYGCALSHRNQRYTILLAVSPTYRPDLISEYAQLLSVSPLKEDRFCLKLKGNQSAARLLES